MTDPKQSDDSIADYRRLLALLEGNLKYLRTAEVEPRILDSYKRLLHYLRTRPAEKIPELLGQHSKAERPGPRTKSVPTDDEIRSMKSEEVRMLASDLTVTRRVLEQIAAIRFGVSRGGLSNLRNRKALVEKLLTLASNEITHESIARVADSVSSQNKK